MELTPEQIRVLFAFVETKGVKPYDVQVELVDHLATDIEQLWSAMPRTDFEEALQTVHAKFGRWGFDYLLQKAEQNALKQQEKLFWIAFGSFFRWPKAVFTAVFAVFIWWGFEGDFFGSENRWIWFAMMCIVSLICIFVVIFRQRRIKNLPTTAAMPYWFGFLCQIPTWFNMFLGSFFEHLMGPGFPVWATLLVVLGFTSAWAMIEVYLRMFEESKRRYPQAFA